MFKKISPGFPGQQELPQNDQFFQSVQADEYFVDIYRKQFDMAICSRKEELTEP